MPHYVPQYFILYNHKFFYYNNFEKFISYIQFEKNKTILSLGILKSHFHWVKTIKTADYLVS